METPKQEFNKALAQVIGGLTIVVVAISGRLVPDGWLYREIERRPQEMGWFARTGGDLANATAAKYYLITGDKWGLERLQTKVRVENATLRYTKGSSR